MRAVLIVYSIPKSARICFIGGVFVIDRRVRAFISAWVWTNQNVGALLSLAVFGLFKGSFANQNFQISLTSKPTSKPSKHLEPSNLIKPSKCLPEALQKPREALKGLIQLLICHPLLRWALLGGPRTFLDAWGFSGKLDEDCRTSWKCTTLL